MTGPSAVTVSLMDGPWKEGERLPLGPSLSDAWWRFGGLIEVKVSSNRTKFPAVITKKIKGWRCDTRAQARLSCLRTQGERDEFLNMEGNWCLCSWISAVLEQTGQPYSSPVPTLLAKSPWSPAQHSCCCDRGGMTDTAPHPRWKIGETASSNVLAPSTIWKPEFLLFPFFQGVMWVKFHVQYVWAICNKNTEGKTSHHTSCYGALISWCP